MSTVILDVRAADAGARAQVSAKRPGRVRQVIGLAFRLAIGGLLCLHPLGALVMVGWVMRVARLAGFGMLARAAGADMAILAKKAPALVTGWRPGKLPNWIWPERWVAGRSRPWHALSANLAAGVAMLFNTFVLLGPAQVLMTFAWWGGWENSFNKGYEQAWVGPVISLIGIAWFLLASLYASQAIGRQTLAGWRAFYDWRLNWRLFQIRPWIGARLAVASALACVPFSLLHVAPFGFPKTVPGFETFTAEQYHQLAVQYGWAMMLYCLVASLFLRWLAVRGYVRCCLAALAAGAVRIDELRPAEIEALRALDLAQPAEPAETSWWLRWLIGLSRRTRQLLMLAVALAAWFGVIAQLYVSQFLNHEWLVWLNHPLFELIWVRVPLL